MRSDEAEDQGSLGCISGFFQIHVDKQSPKNSKPRGVKPQKYTGPANHKCNICTKFKRNI
jgi:hypothetical protein